MPPAAKMTRGRWIGGSMLTGALLLAIVVIAVVIIHTRQVAVAAIPAGWQEVSPQAGATLTSYAFSDETPGLIVAALGDFTGNRSEDGPGPATLWRTHDGGHHWQPLAHPPPLATGGAVAMIAGGHGTVLLEAGEYAASSQLLLSHDAGNTWKALALPPGVEPHTRFTALSQGVYRDGKLYASVDNAFAVSADDGVTWTPLTPLPVPTNTTNQGTLSITPDYRAPHAWVRLDDARQPNDTRTIAQLLHSDDDGHTWTPLTAIQPGDMPYLLPQGYLLAQIATQPTTPQRLCLALSVPNDSNVHAATSPPNTGDVAGIMQRHGPPYMPRRQLLLARSDDAGATWHYSGIDQGEHGVGDLVTPLVMMDAQGDCYAATTTNGFMSANVTATIWHLSASTNASAQPLASITHYSVSAYMVLPSADAQSSQLFLVETPNATGYSVTICSQNQSCYVHHDQPHLIWHAILERG